MDRHARRFMRSLRSSGDARSSFSTPVILLLSLVCGVVFAVGQHLFYEHLDGLPVSTHQIYHVSQQRFNTTIGLALAFLVKESLSTAVSNAYVQAFWRAARNSATGQRLATLDTTFSAIGHALSFFNFKTWYRYPLLWSLAVAAWCIPLASIFAPAALSVQNVPQNPQQELFVPTLDFASLDFMAPANDTAMNGTYWYKGPSAAVTSVVQKVMLDGEILPISSPSPNSSWTSSFWGPSLHCGQAAAEEQTAIWGNWLDWFYMYENESNWPCYEVFGYASWVANGSYWLPFGSTQFSSELELIYHSTTYGKPWTMFLVSTPWNADNFTDLCYRHNNSLVVKAHRAHPAKKDWYISEIFKTALLLKCQITNDSYTVDFKYVNGDQGVTVSRNYSGEPLNATQTFTGPLPPYNISKSGMRESTNASCSTLNVDGQRCFFDVDVLRTLAFQAVADAFSSFIYGTIGITNPNVQRITMRSSDVIQTVLMKTRELAFYAGYETNDPQVSDLAAQMLHQAGSDYVGLSNGEQNVSIDPLGSALEDLFTKATVSLMSDPYLRPNYTSKYAPPPAMVTFTTYHNVYSYERLTLWIPYGVAIGLTCLQVIVGLIIIYLNGASYDKSFSTVLRVSRNAELSDGVRPSDDGRRPLPASLAKSTLIMHVERSQRQKNSPIASCTAVEGDTSYEPDQSSDEARERHAGIGSGLDP